MLKFVAMLAMVIDHVGTAFFPDQPIFRIVGRLAMPLFAFAIARGFHYTSDRKRYFIQLTILAIISQVPFMLLFDYGIMLNMVFPWALAVLALMLPAWGAFLVIAAAVVIPMDYTGFVILLPVILYHFGYKKEKPVTAIILAIAVLSLVSLVTFPLQWWSLLSIPIVLLLNEFDSKVRINKWFFYWFYPAHMLVLWISVQLLFSPIP